jgi:hypothetical protein
LRPKKQSSQLTFPTFAFRAANFPHTPPHDSTN